MCASFLSRVLVSFSLVACFLCHVFGYSFYGFSVRRGNLTYLPVFLTDTSVLPLMVQLLRCSILYCSVSVSGLNSAISSPATLQSLTLDIHDPREQRYSMWTCLRDFTKFVILFRQEISLSFFWSVTYCPWFGAESKATGMKLNFLCISKLKVTCKVEVVSASVPCIGKGSLWVTKTILLSYH